MKKTTKIIFFVLACVFCFATISLNAFAANYSKSVSDTTSLPDYRLIASARFYELVREGYMYTAVQYQGNTNQQTDMAFQCTMSIRYTDNTYGGGGNYDVEGTVGYNSNYLSTDLIVPFDPNKLVNAIFTDHGYISKESGLRKYIYVDLFAGVDFPEEG